MRNAFTDSTTKLQNCLLNTPINTSLGIRTKVDLNRTLHLNTINNQVNHQKDLPLHMYSEESEPLECLAFEERQSKRKRNERSDQFESLDECLNFAVEQQDESNHSIKALLAGQPRRKQAKSEHLQPTVFIKLNSRASGKPKVITLKALLDTGASATILKMEHAKKLKVKVDQDTTWATAAGVISTSKTAKANFTMPELDHTMVIQWDFHLAKHLASYDMIIGRDLLQDLGIKMDFDDMTVNYQHVSIPMKPKDGTYEDSFFIQESISVQETTERVQQILEADYHPAELEELCGEYLHLEPDEREQLLSLLKQYEPLFNGTLGTWTGDPYEIELKPDAEPYHAKAYPIPKIHEQTLKNEVRRLCEIGVLKRINNSEWAAPNFIIRKKNGRVRFLTDFRELNKRIRRKPFPIPKIQDLLLKLEGFQYATSLDLNMGYYHISLSPFSQQLCTIVLPWGKYSYEKLPMGLCNSPDIFQEKMSLLMDGLDFCRTYLDDLLVTTKLDFQDHLKCVGLVLDRIQKAGLKINAEKSFFGMPHLEYLGFWITRNGIQPIAKKVDAIQALAEPTNKKELRHFIGVVNYYRDMWVR
jgi:predicted aspartyl protease